MTIHELHFLFQCSAIFYGRFKPVDIQIVDQRSNTVGIAIEKPFKIVTELIELYPNANKVSFFLPLPFHVNT